jgi:hypothetical protein
MLLKAALWCIAGLSYSVVAQNRPSSSAFADRVEYQTFELDGEIQDMMWCGQNDESILVQTSDGTIYRSKDRGNSWKKLKTLMQIQGKKVADDE